MMLDLDDFKVINDSLGHLEGNRVLRQVVSGMQRVLNVDDLIGRYGGDEFCIACLLDGDDSIQQRAQLLHLASQQPKVKLGHLPKPIRTTMGAYISKAEKGLGAEYMLQKADAALIRGKESGKGGIFGLDQGSAA